MIHRGFKYYFWSMFVFAICVSLSACIYDEGDEVAAQAFEKMTAQEKMLYDAVAKQWNQKKLRPIRDAIRLGRKIKPEEAFTPFSDIGALIEKNDSVTLIMDSGWGEDTIRKKRGAKWSVVDPDWFRKITGQGIATKEPQRIYNKVISPPSNPKASKVELPVEEINKEELVPFEELDELRYLMKGCDEAIRIFDAIISKGYPLTYGDRERIFVRVLFCEAERVNDKIRGE